MAFGRPGQDHFSFETDLLLDGGPAAIVADEAPDPLPLLVVIETRLACDIFTREFGHLDPVVLPPVFDARADANAVRALFRGDADLTDPRVARTLREVHARLIAGGLDCGLHFGWWTEAEFDAVVVALKNFALHGETALAFHARTGILSKSTSEVVTFATQIRRRCIDRKKGPIAVPEVASRLAEAPESLAGSRAARAWTTISARDADVLRERMDVVRLVRPALDRCEDYAEFDTKSFLELILRFGLDARLAILADRRFPFRELLSAADIEFCLGDVAVPAGGSAVPDFLFDEQSFFAFLRTARDGDAPDPIRVSFVMPAVTRIRFGMGHPPVKKRRGPEKPDDAEEFAIGRRRRRS
jgi:hypothetical protein